MTKTRRQAKAALEGGSTGDGNETEGHDEFTVTIPEDVDLDSLSDIVGIPAENAEREFKTPSPETIATLYRLLVVQAEEGRNIAVELDESRAELEKRDVELDQALQDKESVSKEYENTTEGFNKQLEVVRKEKEDLIAARNALQARIDELSNNQTSSSSEVHTLKARVEETEREKRDLVGVISRLKQEAASQEEEIQTLRTNLREARQEHQSLEGQVRELRSNETSTKFKIETLTQQLQLAQSEAERSNAELTTKMEEFSKQRRAKHAEFTTLQASFDSLTQSNESTQSTLKALQSNYSNQNHQLTEALVKVQDLTSQLAEREATFTSEADGLRRLVAMMEEREAQARDIVEGIEKEWAEVGEKSERREAALKEETERERKAREAAEKKVEQLEIVLDKIGKGELPMPARSSPGTPMKLLSSSTAGDPTAEAMMVLSPTVAMASKVQRSGKTFTEVYADYVRIQEELAKKTLEYEYMERTLKSALGQIEERAPIINQQREEYERLQLEAGQLASQLAQAISERDAQGHLAVENAQKLEKSIKENELLQKQLEDLGRQVQGLLREISRRDDPTIPADEDMDTLPIAPAEDTEAVITNNLVLFKSIGGLQEQNQKLLKIVREMGRKMETEEREYKDAMEKEQMEAIREAHEAIQEVAAKMETQKATYESTLQAYVKERDALRALLDRAQKSGGLKGVNGGLELVQPAEESEVQRELDEVQTQFEMYKKEMGVDSSRLREEFTNAQREIGHLNAQLAKANARVEFMADRQRMDQEQIKMNNRELDDLQKRNQQLHDSWARVDIECGRVTEELQVAAGRIEQLRNECANLRAEKKIWESVQDRLTEENKNLSMERSHLSDLMTNVQKMHADLERSGENDRRRLEIQVQMLEGQAQDLRNQLTQERDNTRHLTLSKDIELKDLQQRLDKIVADYSKSREDLIEAQTTKKHLEERVEGLVKQLQGNEEKLAVYERRTNTATTIAHHQDPNLSREQQLEAEVAELRSALKVAELDLATARSHVQQFQEISQANEQALANLNSTFDEYRSSTEAEIARHESECQSLQTKLKAAEEELASSSAKLREMQKSFDGERNAWLADKKTLEDTIVDMSTSEKHSESDRAAREDEVKNLRERTQAAEERYSNEVVSHAESIKTIEALRRDLSTAQASARENLTSTETARANLAASEASWTQQKAALEKEIADLNTRAKDLASQNAILHQHLESVSSQANRIRAAASSTTTVADGEASGDSDAKLSELRAVVSYLRKEKEIVDLQLELVKKENARFKLNVDHLQKNLDETRKLLSEEREKAVQGAASAAQHQELMERIELTNMLRESNGTLRANAEASARKAQELQAKLDKLSAELDPAKEQARTAEAELEACKGQLKRLEEESRRWQERNAQLLSKYDRIDPAEVQALRDEIEQLKAAKAAAEQTAEQAKTESGQDTEKLRATITAHEAKITDLKAHITRNLNIFKNKIATADATKKALEDEKAKVEARVAELEKQVAAQATAPVEAAASSSEEVAAKQAEISALQQERDKLLAEKASLEAAAATNAASSTTDGVSNPGWETEKAALASERDQALEKLKTATEEAQKSAEEAKNLKRQSENFQLRIQAMMKTKAADAERLAASEKARAEAQANSGTPEDVLKQHAEQLEKLTTQHQEELKAAVEVAKKEGAATASNAASGGSADVDMQAKIDAALAEYKTLSEEEHKKEIEKALENGRQEMAMKSKLKDSQLVRAQKKVKDLEAQILEWKNKGLIPDATPAAGTAAASTPTAPATTPAAVTATPAKPAAGASAATPATPANANGAAAKPGATPTATRGGAGRGAPTRGRVLQRAMGGAVGAGRGGAPGAVKATTSQSSTGAATTAAAPAAGGVSIMGAANKRPREAVEGAAAAGDDSLAKRLKPAPAEGQAAAAKPVQIRRPGPGAGGAAGGAGGGGAAST